jgi:hypothetical protein
MKSLLITATLAMTVGYGIGRAAPRVRNPSMKGPDQ